MTRSLVCTVAAVFLVSAGYAPALIADDASDQKAVLLTGASSGIGLKITEKLSANGFHVYAGARKEADLERLNAMDNVSSVRLDVTVQEDIDAAVEFVKDQGRGLYGVVNNAGVGSISLLATGLESDMDFVFDVNVYGPFRVNQAFLPLLDESDGRTTIIGSASGTIARKSSGIYSMSKFAVEAYTDSLALEVAGNGVHASIVEPGGFRSKFIADRAARALAAADRGEIELTAKERARHENAAARSAVQKEPDEVADAILDLMTAERPKRRYLVTPNEGQAQAVIEAAMRRLVQLNHAQPYAYDREGLIAVLDEMLAEQREEVFEPYKGPSIHGTDSSSLNGKVMTGYQGWFNCKGDGAGLGWTHWATSLGRDKLFGPGNVTVDLWPDVSEYDEDELCTTGFIDEGGTPARVFSSHNRKTVIRHFKWMADYGIDGAFVQRFTHSIDDETMRYHKDKVLSSAREGANRHGRTYAVMYDLTRTEDHKLIEVFDDWQMLIDRMHITEDPAYQHHNGRPLVAIWGVGFNNQIKVRPSFSESARLIRKFKEAGYSVMLGVPTGWRRQDRDALVDPDLHDVLLLADVLSPWTVGRFRDLSGVENHAGKYWGPDIAWARDNKIDYMPVIFPGFSRHNMKGDELGAIPRLQGQFLWSQVVATVKSGANMLYIAMFDEVDEGTAIFKITNQPPTSEETPFLNLEGLPSDYYLRLAGEAGKLLRKEVPLQETSRILFKP